MPATDLGFLLHKHPDRLRSVDLGFGDAHVFFPEAGADCCTAALLVEVDPIGRRDRRDRGRGQSPTGLGSFVNDRPYVASSLLSVAIGRVFGSALRGACDARPELVERPFDLVIGLPAVPVRGGAELLNGLFGPLGYAVEATAVTVDPQFPSWGDSRYLSVRLSAEVTVQRALEHLYVLLPVLDDDKHYWIGQDEVDKLLRRSGAWLPDHPSSDLIARRYLRFGGLAREALVRLSELGDDPDLTDEVNDEAELVVERPISLNQQRLDAVIEAVRAAGGGTVLDLGCGEGRLLQRLVAEPSVTRSVGVDVSIGALQRAAKRLRIDEASERGRDRVELVQGALTYLDRRLQGFDVAAVVEVIEHIDPERLDVFAEVLFAHTSPKTVIVTTPNREYNATFEGFELGGLRHSDHRFEWTRAEFADWVASIEDRFGYRSQISGIGADDPETGQPTQMVVFTR